MTTQIALLRAINLGSHQKLAMPRLRKLVEDLGFQGAQTLLQTGNVVFRAQGHQGPALEALLEQAAARELDLHTDFFARSAREWQATVQANPFPAEARRDPSHLLVVFLKQAPAPAAVEALRAAITGPEVVEAVGQQAYLYYPAGIGRSRVTNLLIERKLGARGTGRNWNTVLKLAALAGI